MEILFWILPLIAWIITIVDIGKSEFRDNSRMKWMVLVVLLSFIGMMFYYYFGIRQKEKYRFRFLEKI